MFRHLAIIPLLLAFPAVVGAQTQPANGSYAIVDVRIDNGDGHPVDHATIVLRDGVIQEAGANVKPPPDAEIIKGAGLVAYPGFIDAATSRGLKLPEWQPDQDRVPDSSSTAPASMREANRKWIRPELRARDCLALTEAILAPMRKNGFCSAVFVPSSGLIGGVSTLANLNGSPRRNSIIVPGAGLAMSFSPFEPGAPFVRGGGGSGYPGSLLGIIAHMRQTLLDAERHEQAERAAASGSTTRIPFDDTLDALQPALAGSLQVFFTANTKNEIERAFRLGDEFHLRIALSGGGEAWKVAPILVKRSTPVLASLDFGDEPGVTPQRGRPGTPTAPGRAPVPPAIAPLGTPARAKPIDTAPATDDMPPKPSGSEEDKEDDTPKAVTADEHRKWEERVACAAKLDGAGVSIAFTTSGLKSPADFWKNLRRSITAGLPRDAALRALTETPARLLGVDRQLGSIHKGKMANIVLMTGDFASPASKVKLLFIDRNKFDPELDAAPAPVTPAPIAADDDSQDGER